MNESLEIARQCAARLFELGDVSASRFFGGAALRLDGTMFAMVMRGAVYLRVDGDRRGEMIALGGHPFIYRGRGRDVALAHYLSVPDEVVEDPVALSDWGLSAYRAALIASAGKRKRKPSRPRWR